MNKKQKNSNDKLSFLKIIYFDEEAATDLLCIRNKGKLINEIKNSSSSKNSEALAADASVGAKLINFFFRSRINIEAKGDLTRKAEKLVNQIVTNDVLSDYLEIAETDKQIKKFYNALVAPYPKSLTYIKLMTPYMVMSDGKLDAGELRFDISAMDDALSRGKGYYEMVLKSDGVTKILRLNLTSFKNSYSLADLPKMNLTYHAVKVGQTDIEQLDVDNEFKIEQEKVDPIALANEQQVTDGRVNAADVYDVLFAGVAHEN